MLGSSTKSKSTKDVLYDQHPLNLNKDDFQRVCRVPKKKVPALSHPSNHIFLILFLLFVLVSMVILIFLNTTFGVRERISGTFLV